MTTSKMGAGGASTASWWPLRCTCHCPPAPGNSSPFSVMLQLVHKFPQSLSLVKDQMSGCCSCRYRLTRLPKYMVLHMRRFTKNNFFVEKNPTIVNFPVKNLKLQDIVPVPTGAPDSVRAVGLGANCSVCGCLTCKHGH